MRKFNIQDLVEVLCGATFTAKFITFFVNITLFIQKAEKPQTCHFQSAAIRTIPINGLLGVVVSPQLESAALHTTL